MAHYEMKEVFSDRLYLFWVHIQGTEWCNMLLFYVSLCSECRLLISYLHFNINYFLALFVNKHSEELNSGV